MHTYVAPAAVDRRHFDHWTSHRAIRSLGTNDGATPLAFQTWHRFKEAFAPELIERAITGSSIAVQRIFDPFGGSGTTALASQFLGVASETVEVNPFLADVIRAKLTKYDVDATARALAFVRGRSRRTTTDPTALFRHLPQTFLPPGKDDRWLFDADVAERLSTLLNAINEIAEPNERRLFRVIVGGLLVEVSNVVVSGKGRRYRRRTTREGRKPPSVDGIFAERASRAIRDIAEFADRPQPEWSVVEGDARRVAPTQPVDLCVFSPPYPNSFDYTDVYNLELWMLGYLAQSSENRALRRATLSSHVQISREFAPRPAGSQLLETTASALRETTANLWSPWIPAMVDAYFSDLVAVLSNVGASLSQGAQVWMVVGDSRYAGVDVPVGAVLCELAAANGWTINHAQPIRHMRSSAQQGGRSELAESLIVLTR